MHARERRAVPLESDHAKSAKSASRAPSARRPTSARAKAATPAAQEPARHSDADERRRLIAQAAYFRAERRGFAPGGEERDWLEAEAEVDALLAPTSATPAPRAPRRAARSAPGKASS
jgi:hypothetical protein